ncbi:phosphatase PAP2 family protein [Streptomyces malaysiensis]|uniref:Phosphatase PAP2 family protein n=1 Tax=Streptomyces malaysiensis subsp. samsunensis TaxID=459658 RepID=A0A9X2RTF5_STRMQ|nr:phosphatase PAP2 family protein [Streptomyces samsunensis]MCQ8830202.1 phosphatase PAP2 family protein [Streptomyces samsunensis]
MRETPRSQGTAGDAEPVLPQPRPGCALAHTTGASGSGSPHRSDGRPPQTPRGARHTGRHGGPGTTPPVPGPPTVHPPSAPRAPFRAPLALSAPPLALIAPLVPIALLALCTWQIAAHGPLRTYDERLGRALAGSAFPSPVAEFLADLGNTAVAVPVLAVALGRAAWCARRAAEPRWWLPPLAAAVAMAVVPALVVPFKALIDRPGPPGPLSGESGFFPSGHAATAAVAYGAAALLLHPFLRPRLRRPLLVAVAVLNVAVAAGLVRRGYHWPLDTVASWCLCGPLLWTVLKVTWSGRSGHVDRSRAIRDASG